jgi:diguanylate cyclase (GGDEF)-like protein
VPDIVTAVRAEAAGMVSGAVCDAAVVLRRDDGTYALPSPSAAAGARGEPQPVRADAVARQAVERGRPEAARTPDGRARLVAPLLAAGQALGYIEFTAHMGRQFRPQEVELATLLAGQAAAALERVRALRALQSRSAVDTVSGLYSRWYFFERLYAEVARARRYREPLSLVLAEIDREDVLAASRGAGFRDAALAAVARLVLSSLRDKVDVACRLGAGRFALLLPNTPPGPSAAGLVAERIRVRVAGTHLSDDEVGELGRFTMSLGVAGYPEAAEDADELMTAAEARLTAALAAGGDRIEPPLPDPKEEEGEAPEGEPA